MKKNIVVSLGLMGLCFVSFASASEVGSGVGCSNTWAICLLNQQMKSEIASAKSVHQTAIQSLKDQEKANKELIEANKKNFVANFSGAKNYVIKPLTWDQKLAVDAVIKAKDDAMKALQTATNALIRSWSVDRSGYIVQATDILTSFRTAMLPYIAPEKSASFDQFIQVKINMMISNVAIRQSNSAIKMEIGNKKVAFKDRLAQKKAEFKSTVATMKQAKTK